MGPRERSPPPPPSLVSLLLVNLLRLTNEAGMRAAGKMEKALANSQPFASRENKNPVIKNIDVKMSYGHKQLGSLGNVRGRRFMYFGRNREPFQTAEG